MSAHAGAIKTYFLVFGTLMAFTLLTVWAAFQNLHALNAPIALVIATIKATLVTLFFMHVKDSGRLIQIAVLSGVFWLGILLTLTMTDFLSRAMH